MNLMTQETGILEKNMEFVENPQARWTNVLEGE